ncbi:MAG: nuclear transport factor 2 family protein [Dehalococcoidia bacterium]
MTWGTSANKETVQIYMEAYARWDHATILGCLTDDVEWYIPGALTLNGKDAFDAEIEGRGNAGPPRISVDRMIEEDDVVVAEGQVVAARTDGSEVKLVFCDIFFMRGGKISKLTSYLVAVDELPKT